MEFSWFWTTPAAGAAGDQQLAASGYTQTMWSNNQTLIAACNGGEGVAPGGPGYLATALMATVPAANTVRVQPGGCISDGHGYINGANNDINIPSSSGGGVFRYDRIVARCVTASFTVRLFRIAGVEGVAPSAPAITQTPGATYDIKLWLAYVNSVGTVTITDERTIANVLPVNRQGGSATDWANSGTTNYLLAAGKIQSGQVVCDGAGNLTVTFPVPFSYTPLVLTQSYTLGVPRVFNLSGAPTATGFSGTCYLTTTGAAVASAPIIWLAIGPV